MSTAIRVLHVEDDRIHQGLIGLHLLEMKEFLAEIEHCDDEDAAVEAWRRGNFDLVILDYQLPKGNGLSCLRRIRELDPVVPIIAISAIASTEAAACLIEAGADDYLAKQNLNSLAFCQSVRNVLIRANAFRHRFCPPVPDRQPLAVG